MSARFGSSPHFDKLRNLVLRFRCCFLLIVSCLRFDHFSFYGHPSSLFWFRKVSLLSLQLLICVFLRFDLNFDFCFWKRRWMSSTLRKVSRRLALGHWNLFCYLLYLILLLYCFWNSKSINLHPFHFQIKFWHFKYSKVWVCKI